MDGQERGKLGVTFSGGGFRATLFHLGVVRFLYETSCLEAVKLIGAVSGGSILAAHLVLQWDQYTGTNDAFDKAARELIRFTQADIRGQVMRRWLFAWISLLPRFLLPKTKRWTSCNLLKLYYQSLFQHATLKDLRGSGRPGVTFNCTSLSTGSPCFFRQTGFSWYNGKDESFVSSDETAVAFAVAASSAFPPLFPPIEISNEILATSKERFPQTQYLTDGGVYDNLGIDRILWDQQTLSDLDTFLISDAEGDFDANLRRAIPFR